MNRSIFVYSACCLLAFVCCGGSFAQHSINGFFGVNVHVDHGDSPEEFPAVVDWIRDYSDWPNFEPENNQYTFRNLRNNRNFDSLYKRTNSLGVKNLLVIEDIPKWISPAPWHKHSGGFAPAGKTAGLTPGDYTEASEFFYQLAARYGSKKVPKEMLLSSDKETGLDVVQAIEVLNEADGDTSWGNFVSTEQYAALLNAVYDGNKGAMGKGYGIKAADPGMLVSITGLGNNLASLKKIVAAAGRAPFDIINLHFYAFRNVREKLRVSVPPEWSSLEKDMKEAVAWRNRNAPGKPVWLTEIGWDTRPNNTEAVTEQESANYLIRSYMIALGAGVEKCFWYYWEDYDDTNPIVFSSMGLFENKASVYRGTTILKPKLTYWYLASMRHILKDMNFRENLSGRISKTRPDLKTDSTIYRYDFSSPDGRRKLSVAWYCPGYQYDWRPLDINSDRRMYSFISPGKNWKIKKVVRPIPGSFDGAAQPYTQNSNLLSVSLNATPLFVEWEEQ